VLGIPASDTRHARRIPATRVCCGPKMLLSAPAVCRPAGAFFRIPATSQGILLAFYVLLFMLHASMRRLPPFDCGLNSLRRRKQLLFRFPVHFTQKSNPALSNCKFRVMSDHIQFMFRWTFVRRSAILRILRTTIHQWGRNS